MRAPSRTNYEPRQLCFSSSRNPEVGPTSRAPRPPPHLPTRHKDQPINDDRNEAGTNSSEMQQNHLALTITGFKILLRWLPGALEEGASGAGGRKGHLNSLRPSDRGVGASRRRDVAHQGGEDLSQMVLARIRRRRRGRRRSGEGRGRRK